MTPLVTVLLPALNASRYLGEAISSILDQTVVDFELIVLDGGSSDATAAIAEAFAARDSRVRVERAPGSHPTHRVDAATRRSAARYIALQHADDISYRHRLETQLAAFERDPSLAVCGAAYRSFWHVRSAVPEIEGSSIHRTPLSHEDIRCQLPFWWVMHAATLILDREKVLAAGLTFENDFQFVNDYWQTVTHCGRLRYGNVDEELSAYRLHRESDGARNTPALDAEVRTLKVKALEHWGFSATAREQALHAAIRLIPDDLLDLESAEAYDELAAWLENLRWQNQWRGIFPPEHFEPLLDRLQTRVAALKKAAYGPG